MDADPPCASYLTTALDGFLGENPANPDLRTDGRLFWHRAITIIRFPLQAAEILGTIWYMQSGT